MYDLWSVNLVARDWGLFWWDARYVSRGRNDEFFSRIPCGSSGLSQALDNRGSESCIIIPAVTPSSSDDMSLFSGIRLS